VIIWAVLRQFVGFLLTENFGKFVIFGRDLTEVWIGGRFLSGCGGEFCNLLKRHEKELSVRMLESTCEGCCSDKGYLGGLSRGIGLGLRFGIGIGIRFRFRFRFRTGFGFRVGFRIPLRNLLQRIYRMLIERLRLGNEGIEIGLGNRTGIMDWSLRPSVKGDCLAIM